jgi:putative transposase
MPKKTNQNFINIPYDKFIKQIQYKAENYGIKTITSEERYTSGTSFLDNEKSIKENYNKSRRIKRGLFKSNKGILINADLNGSYQIIKKVFPNIFDGTEVVYLHPVRVNII